MAERRAASSTPHEPVVRLPGLHTYWVAGPHLVYVEGYTPDGDLLVEDARTLDIVCVPADTIGDWMPLTREDP